MENLKYAAMVGGIISHAWKDFRENFEIVERRRKNTVRDLRIFSTRTDNVLSRSRKFLVENVSVISKARLDESIDVSV